MHGRVLYVGDGTLETGAGYLGGVMAANGLAFDHIESGERVDEKRLALAHDALIISDFPAAHFSQMAVARIVEEVERGCGLLMIGGWNSFHGLNGLYDNSPLASVLPVEIEHHDDRINWPYLCMMCRDQDHEILASLPFEVPPSIGGLNRVRSKAGCHRLLSARCFQPRDTENGWTVVPKETHPLLVVGSHREGRTACYMSDVAPHWCGGSVDWGTPRITCSVGGRSVEVGSLYARFLAQLVRWVARADG